MSFKKVKVVMLSTNKKAKFNDLVIHPIDGLLVQFKHQNCTEVAQNLYFLSDEEIKEGDWMFHNLDKKPIQWNGEETEANPNVYGYKKIIATTELLTSNINLPVGSFNYLPQPSQSFIEKYVEEYNKGNVITEVMVEYLKGVTIVDELQWENKELHLKVNPKDNTITIRKVKESWNREEVKQLFDKMYATDIVDANVLKVDFDKWIEENL